MKKAYLSMHFPSYQPRDKLVTYYLYCYDKAAREQIRGSPSNSAPTPKKKLSEPER